MVAKQKQDNTNMELVPYKLETAVIEGLKSKYLDITIQPDDKAAYSMVMSGLRECREIRIAVDAWHKGRKEWIVKAGHHYDGERRRVHALVAPIEEHLAGVRKVEDDRKEAIKAEAEKKELERVEGIRAKIDGLRKFATIKLTMSSAQITDLMDNVADIIINEQTFMEFKEEAERVKNETWETLEKLKKERSEWEQEQAAAKAESVRLEKIRQEQEAEREKTRKEREALEAERRKIEADRKALEDAKKADQERKERAEFERRAKEEAKAMAEAEANEKVEREAKQKAERVEREKAEAERKEALRPDKQKLLSFSDSLLVLQGPHLESEKAKAILSDAAKSIKRIAAMIRKNAEEM